MLGELDIVMEEGGGDGWQLNSLDLARLIS